MIEAGIELVEEAYSDGEVTLPALWAAWGTVDGEPAGQVTFTVNANAERVSLASNIWVDPQYRRMGVATAIIAAIGEAHDGFEINPNGFTPDGEAFWASLYV